MGIPLNQFEQLIDETILKRGLSYFKKGQVVGYEEISPGVYEAIVEGTDEYTVTLTIKNKVITEHNCTCPYDMGNVCKHVAAVIFFMHEGLLSPTVKANSQNKSAKKSKQKTPIEQINAILKQLNVEELHSFIKSLAQTDKEFRNLFLLNFAEKNTSESKAQYTNQINLILKKGMDRHGYIDYSKVYAVSAHIDEMLTYAEKQINKGNYKSAIWICCSIIEVLTASFDYADDSSGSFGMNINSAIDLLSTLLIQDISEEIRLQLFEYSVTAYQSRIYEGWDWDIQFMQLGAALVKTQREGERVLEYLEKTAVSEFVFDEIQLMQLQIIKKIKGNDEAAKFIENNLANPKLRRIAINMSIEEKNYSQAISLLHDAIKQDEKGKPGLVYEWYDVLLKIAQAQSHTDKIIQYARFLFVNNYRYGRDYYAILKTNIPVSDWTNYVEGLISTIKNSSKYPDRYLIAQIYINEQWWDRLFDFVAASPNFNELDAYEKYLIKDFANELIELYKHLVIDYLQLSVGRSHYKFGCKYLSKMKKMGGHITVNKIVTHLRIQYNNRPALLEELSKI